jgi:hypothetical protein
VPEAVRRSAATLIATAAAGAALAACGEDTGPFTVTGVTKPQYVARGDEICAEGERELRQAGVKVSRAPSAAELERVVQRTVLPVVDERIERLRAMEPPPGDEAEVAAIYDAAEQSLERIEARPALAERPDQVFSRTSRLAREYGFEDCAGA